MLSSGALFAAGISVATTRGFSTTLNVECPEITLGEKEVLGNRAVTVTAPESSHMFERGAPELPKYTAMVMIDPARRPIFKVHSLESEIVEIDARVAPSKGNFTRDIDPNDVPYTFGEMYSEDAWFPADDQLVSMTEPFIFRNIRGVNLIVNPVQYNPAQNKLRVHKKLRVQVAFDDEPSANVIKSTQPISSVYEPIYRNVFVNFDQTSRRLPRFEEAGRLLILSYDSFMGAMEPFVRWKRKIGMEVKMVPISAVGDVTTDNIHAFIKDEYFQNGLTHIMLVGGANQIPTPKGVREGADSDPCYTKIEGDDHVPDAMISRLIAENVKQVEYQVAKFVNYERFPTMDNTDWYTRALGIASDEGMTPDYVYMRRNHDALLNSMFTKAYESFDPGANVAQVANAVEEGVSLINYLGHGSGVSWATSRFHNNNINRLNNGWMLPIIWDVACVNGRFVRYNGFGMNWMQAGDIENPAGAVAYAGSTTNMEWVPPIHVQAEMNKNFIANELYKSVGTILLHGIFKGFDMYGTSPYGSGVRMFEQWHIFGDATMIVRHRVPVQVQAQTRAVRSDDGVTLSVNVADRSGSAMENVRVTAYNEGVKNVHMAVSNNQGEAVLTLPADFGSGYVTIMHPDIVPVVCQPIDYVQ